MNLEALYKLHSGLPRESPGSAASTRCAIELLPKGFCPASIADMGCGPGMATLVLAESFPEASILAVDTHQPYLDQLSNSAFAAGIADRVTVANRSMELAGETPGGFDLIWAEGSAYLLGVETALESWRPLLRPGGCIAYTELTWLTDDPPEDAVLNWQEIYPDMNTESGNLEIARSAGFEILGHFVLPASDWWSEYFSPLQRRINLLRPEEGMAEVLDEAEREIDIYSLFGGCFGYVFYVLLNVGAAKSKS
jgi:SAM-dependent methyltransferase